MASQIPDQTVTFIKKASIWGKDRVAITIPPEVAELVHPGQKYEITLRPVGTICLIKT